jgi:O-antigen ligase
LKNSALQHKLLLSVNLKEDNYGISRPALEFLRYTLFFVFYLLSLRLIFVNLNYASFTLSIFLVATILGIAILSWCYTKWVLLTFTASVPLINGIQIVGYFAELPLLSIAFASIYISWATKNIFWTQKNIKPGNDVGNLVDILSGFVILSLIMYLLLYPLDVVFYRVRQIPFEGQMGPFWCIDASQILLQGLFFFRMFDLEMDRHKEWRILRSIFYVHVAVIFIFSLLNWIYQIPAKLFAINVFAPFDDIHSYGSYLVFLFFLFFIPSIYKTAKHKLLNLGLSFALLFFIVLSGSRTTWLALAVLLIFVVIRQSSKYYRIFIIMGALSFIVLVSIYSSTLLESHNFYINRLGNLVNFEQLSKDIALDNRELLWKRAGRILIDRPFTGSGIGTFYRISPQYEDPDDKAMPAYHENTHNYYLQLGSELGIPALCVFFFLIACVYKGGCRELHKKERRGAFVGGLLFGLSAYLMTMLAGHPLLLSNQQFLFWFIIACIVTPRNITQERTLKTKLSPYLPVLLCSLFILVLSVHIYNLHAEGSKIKSNEYGFYAYENWQDDKMRWTMQNAGMRFKALSNLFSFNMVAQSPNSDGPKGLKVKLFLDDELLDEIHFFKGGKRSLCYYMPSIQDKEVQFRIEVNKTFNPLILGFSRDKRELGVAMSPISFPQKMPEQGVGFYNWETSENHYLVEWPQDRPFRYRRTGRRGTINLRTELQKGGALFLRCGHPNIGENPVRVEILADDDLIKQQIFTDYNWKKVIITPDDIKGSTRLTLQVSRTWNPKLSGISQDGRDFGVAMALLEAK